MTTSEMVFTDELTARLVDWSASDESVVASARVSTQGVRSEEYLATPAEESRGLINFLMRNRHGTPFEHNYFTFLVEAPIAVFREWHRHRIGWSYNEESGRYKQLAPKFYLPPAGRPLTQVGKPGAYEFVAGDEHQYDLLSTEIRAACAFAYRSYEDMLKAGIAREVARGVLPVYTYTSMYATCNARSLMAFLQLRTAYSEEEALFPSKPMWEIARLADQLEAQWAELMPITHEAFVAAKRVAP